MGSDITDGISEMWFIFPVEVVLIKVVIRWTWKKLDKAWKKLDCRQVLALIKFERTIPLYTNYWHLFLWWIWEQTVKTF